MRTRHLATFLILLALALPALPAHAGGVVSVCDEAHLLPALAGGGTVTFTCSGTITLTAQITISANTTIDGNGQTVTISGNDAVRVFWVNTGVTFNLNRLTVANGAVSEYGSGGGIYNHGMVNVTNSTFSGNTADYGGGGIFNGGTLTMSNSIFSGNTAVHGGGIFNGGTLTMSNSIFSGNTAREGGGITNWGTVTVSNCTFSNNSAIDDGGGIVNYDRTMTVSNSTFFGNSATYGRGGGIYNDWYGAVTVSNCTFSSNYSAQSGGGIFNGHRLTVSNSTLSGNITSTSYGGGGGIYNDATLTVSNSTLSSNSATNGGGISNVFSGTVTLENTIVANSLAGGNCTGYAITDGGGNLSYPDSTCPGINADPSLDPLQNSGGPTETMALGPGSAAIDAANDAICAAAPVNNLDQRGIVRPQGPHCDIGAVEQYCPSFVPPGTVGVEDIVAIATHWGWTNATPGWDPVYDLNGDNRIDIVDITLVTRAWGRTCS